MKPTSKKILWLLLLALAGGSFARAQTNGMPGAADFATFSRFITERNIFDPNRQPHYPASEPRLHPAHARISSSAPAFTLVGTMSYGKGLFAFFNGNRDDLKQALLVSGKITDYTVTAIAQGRVTLASTNPAQLIELKVGDELRQANGKWELTSPDDQSAGTVGAAVAAGNLPAGPDAPPAASPALGQNKILKRLMQQREKENQ